MRMDAKSNQEEAIRALDLRLAQIQDRLSRLTDAYIDRLIEKEPFEQRNKALLAERLDLRNQLTEWQSGKRNPGDDLSEYLERADGAYLAYRRATPDEKRDLLESLTSNRLVEGKSVTIMLTLPFSEIANRFEGQDGGPRRVAPRTCRQLLANLSKHIPKSEQN